jgi:hypothetical protein
VTQDVRNAIEAKARASGQPVAKFLRLEILKLLGEQAHVSN